MVLALVFSAAALGTPAAATDGVDAYLDGLAEAAPTPELHWSDCQECFQCTAARVPLDYRRLDGDHIDLAVIKLRPLIRAVASVPCSSIAPAHPASTGCGSGRGGRGLFSDELRSRFDLAAWDSRSVARSSATRCFPNTDEQLAFLGSSSEMPTDASGEAAYFAHAEELADRCEHNAGPILNHASSANTARDLELLRRGRRSATDLPRNFLRHPTRCDLREHVPQPSAGDGVRRVAGLRGQHQWP